MRKYCEQCGKEAETKVVSKRESYNVCGELIEVDAQVLVCSECGEEFFCEELDNATLVSAYNEYRRKHKLIKERRQYIGVSGKESFSAMCEDITFLQQSLKTVLADHAEIFRTRYAKGLSVWKAAEELQVNRGVIERRQAALLNAFSQLLHERDQADGTCRLCKKLTDLEESKTE